MPSMPAAVVAVENRAVLGKGDLARGILRRLPVGITRAALDIVDRLAVELEGNAQFDERLHRALPGDDAVRRRRDVLQVAGADRGSVVPAGPWTSTTRRPARVALSVREASPRSGPRPNPRSGRVRDADCSCRGSPLREPMPSEPSPGGGVGCAG